MEIACETMNVMARATLASREDILAQIETTLASISGVATCARDRGLLETDELPAIILLDGREDIVQTNVAAMKSVKMPFAIFRLQPQIFLILPQRDDATNTTVNNGLYQPVGPQLSYWRDAILAALINDPTLIGLLGSEGQIVFRSSETDMQTGSTLQGQLRLQVDFHYVWQPALG
jgi:hypothetical protein